MHKNSFDFLRLLFASFVIITHSNVLTGVGDTDVLFTITHNQITFSYIGVRGFFVISGYLIYQSLIRSSSLGNYFWKRFLRLFPGLFVLLMLTVLLCSFLYEGNIVSYFTNKQTWAYIPNNLSLLFLQFSIPGIFEHNIFPYVINGSLWTIPFEFLMYTLLSSLFFFKDRMRKMMVFSGFVFFYLCTMFFYDNIGKYGFHSLSGDRFLNLGTFFMAGSVLAVIRIENFKYIPILFFATVFLLLVSIGVGLFSQLQFLLWPILVILMGVNSKGELITGFAKKIGDLSYGIYLYAFPVQQTLMHFFPLSPIQLTIFSFVITVLFAYLSWHFVEKKALALKKKKKTQALNKHLITTG